MMELTNNVLTLEDLKDGDVFQFTLEKGQNRTYRLYNNKKNYVNLLTNKVSEVWRYELEEEVVKVEL